MGPWYWADGRLPETMILIIGQSVKGDLSNVGIVLVQHVFVVQIKTVHSELRYLN